ncbi:DUF262 domain-containing protein [Pseudomonas nunensis]|uniref:DUF262 domain-containing protein n=1 Tax=Pseudomonas nunensis TaxID=2961896 RepID=UPI0006B48BB0|nr:DUF262 domain-containing protein [Pseudomonas nunensis]
MSNLDSRINYKKLLARHGRICIPIIQRDYAQGRPEEEEIREDFLQAIKVALNKPVDDPSLPFNLDFIYGSLEGNERTQFLPLDGQQRLTTLFLLHWYLAWTDGEWATFTDMFRSDGKSRFFYRVRPSSNEFFDALVSFIPVDAPVNVTRLSDLITDQSWYFRSWRLDPTIQSVLFMLDAIHVLFASSSNLFGRLICDSQPAITFQLLDLENFGLSDDLYIKMNSRGKPLTSFETFKARYERELKEQFSNRQYEFAGGVGTVSEYVAWRMDNGWADLFWGARDKSSNLYDGAIMNVFRAVALVTRDPESAQYLADIERLRQGTRVPNYSDFHARNWLDKDFSLSVISLLDAWSDCSDDLQTPSSEGQHLGRRAFFQRLVSSQRTLSNTEAIQFAAYVLFLEFNGSKHDSGQLRGWMRVIFNLSENTEYNRTEDLQRSMSALRELLPQSKNMLEYFAKADATVFGFSKQQIEEEKLKAQLVWVESSWAEIIELAEAHGYFRGQIEFLLSYCGINSGVSFQDWDNQQHRQMQSKFQEYFTKASAMFDERGLKGLPNFLWERALLSIGDYLLPNGRNYSFLVSPSTDQASWKRLLRGANAYAFQCREVLKQLFDHIDLNVDLVTQLEAVIEKSTDLEPWIKALVETPRAIGYCKSRCIRFDQSGQIYLLGKTQMNGMHAELFSYALYHKLCADRALAAPFELMYYFDVSGAEMKPRFLISCKKNNFPLRFSIGFSANCFVVNYESFGAVILENTACELRDLKFMEGDTLLQWSVVREDIEAWLSQLAASL